MKILVTGGAGFIGSALCRHIVLDSDDSAIIVDKMTYAANLDSLDEIADNPRYAFEKADIADQPAMERIFDQHRPDAVMNLAAESHVDRSIDGPAEAITTNIIGTYTLLEVSRAYLKTLPEEDQETFRFHHVSTDEVYGSLDETGAFVEETPYAPSSPYAASKAASDHLVSAWGRTYGLPVIISNSSNNYGPRQFPEKLVPLMILNGLSGSPLPVYGTGENVRDWLYVEDHARALHLILREGRVGGSYNVGGAAERRNIDVVRQICALLDELRPESPHCPHSQLIEFVTDRPGHDQRYAIDATKIRRKLGWKPSVDFESGMRQTVRWYLDNSTWWKRINSGAYRQRIGLG